MKSTNNSDFVKWLLACFVIIKASLPRSSGYLDVDYYWHLEYGDWILRNAGLPKNDMWSWTAFGETYRLTQWGGEVVMALANHVGGLMGTQLLAATLTAGCVWFVYKAADVFLKNEVASLAIALLCTASIIWLPCRPHLFSHLMLALFTYLIAVFWVSGNRKYLIALPLITIAWVNLHGGFVLGLGYLLMIGGISAVDAVLEADNTQMHEKAIPLFAAAAACLVATLVNPYGIGAWAYVWDVSSAQSSSMGLVDEWRPTQIRSEVGMNYFIAVATLMACIGSSKNRPSAGTLIAVCTVIAAGWTSIRMALVATLMLAPFIAQHLKHTAFYELVFSARRIKLNTAAGAILAALTLTGSWIYASRIDPTVELAAVMPVDELTELKRRDFRGKLLNAPEIGGFLIREGKLKVHLDTRFDLYGDERTVDYLQARRGQNWQDYISKLRPDALLLDKDAMLVDLIRNAGQYDEIFSGPRYTLLLKKPG